MATRAKAMSRKGPKTQKRPSVPPEMLGTGSIVSTVLMPPHHQVVTQAKLDRVSMVRCDFVLNKVAEEVEAALSFDRKISKHDYDNGVADTVVEWIMQAVLPSGEVYLRVSTEWLVRYVNLAECDASAVFGFCQGVGTMTSYPYFRGIVAQVTWAAGVNVPPMPVITPGSFPSVSLKAFILAGD